MDTLNLTKDKLDQLTVYNKGGYEGRILLYNENMLLKHFEPYLRGIMDMDNKRYKLERFCNREFSSKILTAPKIMVNVDNNFAGYIMDKIPDAVTIDNIKNYHLLIKMYNTLFKKLKYLHNNNIVVSDLKRANIVVGEDNNPIFVDVDSMGIDEFNPDNINHIPADAKVIPNIKNKKHVNSPKEFDNILLLGCFLTSLSSENISLTQKITSSLLSDNAKAYFVDNINQNYIDNENEIIKVFDEEEKRR